MRYFLWIHILIKFSLVSVGIAHNILLARLATRKAKPAGSYHLTNAGVPAFVAPLTLNDVWGFGYATAKKADEKLGTRVLGELVGKSKALLCDALGKGTGEKLFNAIRGIDHQKLQSSKPRKSVSCEINVSHSEICFPQALNNNSSFPISMGYGSKTTLKQRLLYLAWLKKLPFGWSTSM